MRVDRLAARSPTVWFESLTEAAIGILIGKQGGQDGVGRAGSEQMIELQPLQQSARYCKKLLRPAQRVRGGISHIANVGPTRPGVLTKSDTQSILRQRLDE